ncbi:MAG: TetR/AcrR family transcriptional regulator [Mucilaginibacter sp.]|uniref:TetR/AcrR family transcriptional regulator n=1 Tax=Mucilaginibacter sp. TaxID=1882438 RepID=UPI0031A98977
MKEHAGVKERIMETASRLFYQQGYQATGINQIIEEAQIAKASLYQHFASKESLLNEYLETRTRSWMEGLTKFTANYAEGIDKLLGFFDYRMHLLTTNEFKGCAFLRVVYEQPNLNESSTNIIQKHKLVIKKFISDQLLAIKPLSKEKLDETVNLIFNLAEGGLLQATLFKNTESLADGRKVLAGLLKDI